jgi:hypothetical protein
MPLGTEIGVLTKCNLVNVIYVKELERKKDSELKRWESVRGFQNFLADFVKKLTEMMITRWFLKLELAFVIIVFSV